MGSGRYLLQVLSGSGRVAEGWKLVEPVRKDQIYKEGKLRHNLQGSPRNVLKRVNTENWKEQPNKNSTLKHNFICLLFHESPGRN